MSATTHKTSVSLDRLFLALDNPRHEEVPDEGAAIEKLCKTESIEILADDIAKQGVNPSERFIVYPMDEDEPVTKATNFVVAEGNRRVCALKLLNDPNLAPPQIRKRIMKLATQWTPVSELDVVIIQDEALRREWLLRIHDGAAGGRGRIAWKAEQKTRFTGTGRNRLAQAVFDYAEAKGLLEIGERPGRISHMTRLLANPVLRDTLGLTVGAGADDLQRTRPIDDFDLILLQLLQESKNKKLGSQVRKSKIEEFAHSLAQLENLSGFRHEPTPLATNDAVDENDGEEDINLEESEQSAKKPTPPKPPKDEKHLKHSDDIAKNLGDANLQKLSSLYWSICRINVKQHAPLVAIGIWSFLESLATSCGAESKPFKDYWSKGHLSQQGIAKGDNAKAINEALTRLASGGNTTKHDAISAHFDAKQLMNDWTKVQPVVFFAVNTLKQNG